ncbi:MAG: glycosyltransferase family 92 protein [Selenomonadaceae bacterium]|nr:glycosyltransferase family 92 protein [Selenomonadaceae bacterium]
MQDDILFENQLAFVLPVKNESEYIEEWLEYNYAIGVDKFYIYNNESTDRSALLKVLQPWIDKKIVDFEDYPGRAAQLPIYNDAVRRHRFECRYMGFLDTDEFIYIKQDKNLLEFTQEMMARGETLSGFIMFWRCFGTGGQEKKLPGGVIERFIHRSDLEFLANKFTKTILNPRRIRTVGNPHFARYFPNAVCMEENGNFSDQMSVETGEVINVQVNHYMTKSKEEYIKKRERGRADAIEKHLEEEFKEYDRNNIEDTGLRDKWRIMRQDPKTPRMQNADPSIHDARMSLNNLLKMLEPVIEGNPTDEFFRGQIEKFTTCFGLARNLQGISQQERDYLEDISLDATYRAINAGVIRAYNIFLLLYMLPELMTTKSKRGWDLIRLCQDLIPKLKPLTRSYNEMECYVDMRFFERLLGNLKHE